MKGQLSTTFSFCFFVLLYPLSAFSQERDSLTVLQEVTVEAYQANRSPDQVPASIGIVAASDFNRFSTASSLPAFNMLPGVRMEERSPGSYRFSIRGSLLRSPFGVRNVKFYWNGLPFTDGGGNTYINLLDLNAIGRAEVLKGPAGSLYGASTGGAVLIRSQYNKESEAIATAQYGSFGTLRYTGGVTTSWQNADVRIQFTRLQSDGYREQSASTRNSFNAEFRLALNPANEFQVTFLASDLFYQTPGGLTLAQYTADPHQGRPATPTLPGAVEQQAAVYNKTFFGGLTYTHLWSDAFSSSIAISGSTTDFRNPAIRNYETRKERNTSARLTNTLDMATGAINMQVTFGGEYQHLFSPVKVTNNVNGVPGTQLISNDEITTDMILAFAQWEATFPGNIRATVGGSLNYLRYQDVRLALNPIVTEVRTFNPVFSPRIALQKVFTENLRIYTSVSRGFSPPSVAEVVPSTGIYNPDLQAESGWNYEIGMSASAMKSVKIHFATYDFRLSNTIVLQRDSTGADYFINAGNTTQQGVEMDIAWSKNYTTTKLASLRIKLGGTYNHFRFGQYVNNNNDYSGNKLTGVSPFIGVIAADITFQNGLYANLTSNFVDRIPLNDANTDYASDYFLVGLRMGRQWRGRLPIETYAGVDNLLNQVYSLGNDLNAAGGRYYNAAQPRNYYVGISLRLTSPKN